jgi:peptide/nickel transport system ATP-binding protein
VLRGETLSLVGESGYGKTTTGRLLTRLLKPTAGSIVFDGHDITHLPAHRMRPLRRDIQMIFQDPYSALNPRHTVGTIVGAPFRIQGVDPPGGARAAVQQLLEDLQDEPNLTYLLIAHDLSVVRHVSDRVAVMYLGKIVELGDRNTVYTQPRHPYTVTMLSAVPVLDPKRRCRRVLLTRDAVGGAGGGSVGRLSLAHSGGIHRPASGIATSRSPKGRTWSPE